MKIIPPNVLLKAYAAGLFPMAESKNAEKMFWVTPKMRGILPLDGFHLSHSMRRFLKKNPFDVRFNTSFADVVSACADREETWINDTVFDSYVLLHVAGHAHSVECFKDDVLVGGLYGVSLGAAFFGESMFSKQTNASKTALAFLVSRLKEKGFILLDTQFLTTHLASMGAVEIPQQKYLSLLKDALKQKASF